MAATVWQGGFARNTSLTKSKVDAGWLPLAGSVMRCCSCFYTSNILSSPIGAPTWLRNFLALWVGGVLKDDFSWSFSMSLGDGGFPFLEPFCYLLKDVIWQELEDGVCFPHH